MLGVAFVVAFVLFVAPPVMWGSWWLLADLGEAASSRAAVRRDIQVRRRLPAA